MRKDVHSMKAFLFLYKYQCTRYQDINCSHTISEIIAVYPAHNFVSTYSDTVSGRTMSEYKENKEWWCFAVPSVKSTHFKDCE